MPRHSTPRARPPLGLLALVALLVTVAAAPPEVRAADEPSAELPPIEVVRALRAARHAHGRGESAVELAELRAVADAYPDEIAVTRALLEYAVFHGLPEEEHRVLEARMRRRLADVAHPLPIGVLRQMAFDPEASDELLGDLVGHVRTHLDGPLGKGDDAPDLLRLLAGLQQRLGRTAEAAAALESLWRRTGGVEVAWELYGLRQALDDAEGALDLMEAVPEIRDTLPAQHVALLADAGRLDEAREAVEKRIASFVTAPRAIQEGESFWARPISIFEALAWAFRDAGRDREAEELFRRALELAPDDPGLEATVLHLYASQEERTTAAAEVERGWEEQSDPRTLLDEGTRRLASGDTAGAYDLLARAAPGLPDLEAAWYNLGMAAYGLERWEKAAEALAKAEELNPERAANPFFAGVALSHLERCAEAVAALERALALDPSRKQAHYFLAGCLRALGRPEEAERHRALFEPGG